MLLSPAVKTSYLSSMAAAPSNTSKRQLEVDADPALSSPLSGKRARPTISLRGSHSSSTLGQPFCFGQSPSQATSFASSSDITLDDLPQYKQTQRDTYTHSSPMDSGSAYRTSSLGFASKNPHWLKVVTSYGYTFVKSDELHLFEGNADVQMIIEPGTAGASSDVPSSPPPQMRYPLGVEFPPTPSPSDDGFHTPATKYFGQMRSHKPLWEHVEGDQDTHHADGINEMMMDEW